MSNMKQMKQHFSLFSVFRPPAGGRYLERISFPPSLSSTYTSRMLIPSSLITITKSDREPDRPDSIVKSEGTRRANEIAEKGWRQPTRQPISRQQGFWAIYDGDETSELGNVIWHLTGDIFIPPRQQDHRRAIFTG
jgi:hypothetical protein